ncbi:cytochrome B [Marinobacter fuscus]|uniref:Cytochrome B n=1 Tax=Marinobacter fuscus TaxID=2109942 RepID=A0A2T1K7K3_9GAMM|nr:cytochrome b [Marinobacter fuscus]PSF06045.1 cytochrome B [Marinobacter fuscus]
MSARNSEVTYGWVAILLHWTVAVAIVGLFVLGFWMVDLSYYDPWYRQGPDIHRSVGIILFLVMLFRIGWRVVSPAPRPLANHRRWEILAAHAAHWLLYLLIFVAMVSGYLISTADGSSIHVFGVFEVPSVTGQIKGMEDTAGLVHYWSTWALVVLAGIHALGALKHHLIDRDKTLRRMIGLS